MRKPGNEDPMKSWRTRHPPNGNNKFNLNITNKLIRKKKALTLLPYQGMVNLTSG